MSNKIFLTLGEFQAILPILMVGKIRAIFATYNRVRGYKDGEVETGLDNLSLVVQNGGLVYSNKVFEGGLRLFFNPGEKTNFAVMMVSEAENAQHSVTGKVDSVDVPSDCKLIAFIYTGMAGFRASSALAEEVRKKNPTATIVLTMCTCGKVEHRHRLLPLVEQGVANYLVFTEECGGEALMGELVVSVIEAARAQQTLVSA